MKDGTQGTTSEMRDGVYGKVGWDTRSYNNNVGCDCGIGHKRSQWECGMAQKGPLW